MCGVNRPRNSNTRTVVAVRHAVMTLGITVEARQVNQVQQSGVRTIQYVGGEVKTGTFLDGYESEYVVRGNGTVCASTAKSTTLRGVS